MDYSIFQKLVKQCTLGKHLPSAIYLHESALEDIPQELTLLTLNVCQALRIPNNAWNLVKFSKQDFKISLLHYPTFFEFPYPELSKSYTIDLTKLSVRKASYQDSENPPILHRREAFLNPEHPQIEYFKKFTQEGEAIGLYENTRTIGFKNNWERLIKRKGYQLDFEGHLQPRNEQQEQKNENPFNGDIDRHKTAISRDKLSAPLFLLARRGYLNGRYSILDYGCGKGDDLRELEAHDIECQGWDPVHRPETDIESADIVNLGFVINVIEDKEERQKTLLRAYDFCTKILVVSAMLGNERIFERFTPYKDGVITKRNTFQKYYFQGELQNYIETTLSENAIALGPGVFLVFKEKLEEQRYLLERQRTRYQWRQLSQPSPKPVTRKQSKDLFSRHKNLLEDFWYTCLDLARLPYNDEFEHSEQLRLVTGSHKKAFTVCKHVFGIEAFQKAQQTRKDDLLVYFALSFFKKRDSYIRMPKGLQRDIKNHFGKYSDARDLGRALLFQMNNVETIYKACMEAHEALPASQLNGQHDLIFHKQYLHLCPPQLRVYIGCATQLYGELDNVSLIKAHITSGKVTLQVYDDWEKEVPHLTERIKIKLRDQDIDFFDYIGKYDPQPLTDKHIFLAERV